MSNFELSVKSTLDRKGRDIATSLGVAAYLDLDESVNISEVLQGQEPAIVFRFLSIDENPKDPLYTVAVMVGAKTTSDPGNYTLLGFVSKVKEVFRMGEWIPVLDWSGDVTPTEVVGDIYITESGVDPQVSDRMSGVRLLTVEGRAIRRF